MRLSLPTLLTGALGSGEALLGVGVAAVLAAMMVPLPPWLLDVGLAVNLAAAAGLLVTALSARDALEVTAFPTLLLITTLLRLSLNVSSTRLALAEGHAGQVIESFGEFVVRGDYAVGAVVFAILTLVQFLVVAKGAERVAEVSARFTLDAMPGKQMSIDADLRAGAIDQAEARARRRALERESQMFGAMDGAMKFVKGDVLAGLLIVLVNLLGGLCVGVFHQGMEPSEAAGTYALIAIGDGLVSQIPSLCVAVAAGLVVTRVGGEEGAAGSLAGDIGRQFLQKGPVLRVVAGLIGVMALLPGMPHLIFLCLAAVLIAAPRLARTPPGGQERPGHGAAPLDPGLEDDAGGPTEASPPLMPIGLDFSGDLSGWVQSDGMRLVKQDLAQLREKLFGEIGVRFPGIRVRTGAPGLPASSYALLLEELPAAVAPLDPDALLVTASPDELAVLGVEARPGVDPVAGGPASLVPAALADRLREAPFNLRDARQLLLDRVGASLRRHAARFLGLQEVQQLLDGLEPVAPALVRAALEKVPLPLLTDVLKKLLEEDVSIRNLKALLEALVSPAAEGDAVQLAERCRQALSRAFAHRYAPTGLLYVYLVDPEVEELIREHAVKGAVDPEQVTALLEAAGRIASAQGPVLLTAPDVRRPLRKILEGSFPQVAVLTYAELSPDQRVHPLGRLSLARR